MHAATANFMIQMKYLLDSGTSQRLDRTGRLAPIKNYIYKPAAGNKENSKGEEENENKNVSKRER
jgi:hypothetical protein